MEETGAGSSVGAGRLVRCAERVFMAGEPVCACASEGYVSNYLIMNKVIIQHYVVYLLTKKGIFALYLIMFHDQIPAPPTIYINFDDIINF